MTCHHLYDGNTCVHCGGSRILPAAQGHTARYVLASVTALLKGLAQATHAEAYQELHDTTEGLACEMELYPQREAFFAAEFLMDACAAFRLLALERRRADAVLLALRADASLGLRQTADMCRDWDAAAELAHGRGVARSRD